MYQNMQTKYKYIKDYIKDRERARESEREREREEDGWIDRQTGRKVDGWTGSERREDGWTDRQKMHMQDVPCSTKDAMDEVRVHRSPMRRHNAVT